MRISIIVPVYNVEEYVLECLESIGTQSFDGEIECLIIDDRGTDRSMEIVRDFIASYSGNISFTVIEHDINHGLGAARNTGIDKATGDYLLFVDSDDILLPGSVERLARAAVMGDFPVILSPYIMSGEEENGLSAKVEPVVSVREEPLVEHVKQMTNGATDRSFSVYAWGKLIKLSFIREHQLRFPEGILYEDILWSFRLFSNCHHAAYFTAPSIFYRIRPNSIMTGNTIDKWIIGHVKNVEYLVDQSIADGLVNKCTWEYIDHLNRIILNTMENKVDTLDLRNSFIQLSRANHRYILQSLRIGSITFIQTIRRLYFVLPWQVSYPIWRMIRTFKYKARKTSKQKMREN